MTSYLRRTFLAFARPDLGRDPGRRGPLAAASPSAPELIDWAIVAIIVASIVVVLRTHSRLTAITALGGVGAGIAMSSCSTAPSTSR